jgi:type II secretory pathway pseudopilin PulG
MAGSVIILRLSMMHTLFIHRRGSTLIELLIYMVLIGIVIGAVLPLLFMASEDRLLQQTISVVEQNGTQVMQDVTLRIRNSERIVSPTLGHTGSVLVLQTASGSTNPTVIGWNSGVLLIVESTHVQAITSSQIAVVDFLVRNTSTSASHQSAEISFHLSRTTRLQQPHYYMQYFNTDVALFPDDLTLGNTDTCILPSCSPVNTFNWQVYNSALNQCLDATLPMRCP